MRAALFLAPSLLLCAATTHAGGYNPELDQEVFLGDHVLGPLQEVTIPIYLEENDNPVVGFSVSLTFLDHGEGTFSYASDLRMFMDAPFGSLSIGGYDSRDESDLLWDFQGEESDESGPYASGPHLVWAPEGVPKGGEWVFTLRNDWSGSMDNIEWNNVVVTLHKIPEPATAAALLVLGGLALRRRDG